MTGIDKKEKTENALSEVVDSNDKSESNPIDCIEFPEGTPKEIQRTVRMMMSASSGHVRSGHPLFEKFTDDHVHKYLDYIQKDDDNAFALQRSNRWFHLAYVLIGIGLFVFLMVYLVPKDKAMFDQIFKMLVAFAGGFGGGYGVKTFRDRTK